MAKKLNLARINYSLGSDWDLKPTEVKQRQDKYGLNNIVAEHGSNRWVELAKDTITDPMIWFLVGASLLFGLLGDYNQAIILLVATIPLVFMDAFLHWRTQASMQNLTNQLVTQATVIRNQQESNIPTHQLVPGDLVVVGASHIFPADGIIVAGKNLQVEESILTGESVPVTKKNLTKLETTIQDPLVEYNHWGLAGTRLLTGPALLRVVYTGKETIYGEIIASALKTKQERTPLQIAIYNLIFYLVIIATVICLVLAAVRYSQGFGLFDAILSAATLAIAALPEEFPLVFTFFLGVGVYRLARQKALVKRAVSVENIGRVNCICSDKTGTITHGKFQLISMIPAEDISENDLLYFATVASRDDSGDQLDFAIFNKIQEYGLNIPEKIQVFPFTEERKRETGIIKDLIATKGSPEIILALSDLTLSEKKFWLGKISELASDGYKIIACAYFDNEDNQAIIEPPYDYKFAGLLAFEDPPRKEAIQAVQDCYDSNIHVLMITGDHQETAFSIAKRIGLGKNDPKVILADQYNGESLKEIDVIARAVPAQKLAFVKALQAAGNIVAVTGDGVNDVPALKAADIGIAMGARGSQSAREVASIVLLDDNFGSIVNAIAEGRQLFNNLKLSFKYLLLIHIPFVLSAAIIPLLGLPLLYYPIHIVFIELILHPTCLLVFQDLPSSKKLQPITTKKNKDISFFSRSEKFFILLIGFYTTALVVLSYVLILKYYNNISYARTVAFTMLAFTSASLTIGLSSLRTMMAKIITMLVIIAAVLWVQVPIFAKFLGFTALPVGAWVLILMGNLITLGLLRVL